MCWHVSDGSATQKQSENIRKGHRFGAHFHIHKVTFNSGYVQMKVNFGGGGRGGGVLLLPGKDPGRESLPSDYK